MKHGTRSALLWLIPLASQAGAVQCVAIEGPVVRVSALAPYLRPTTPPQPDRILTSAPDPGTRRWITPAEMHQWELSSQGGFPEAGVCVERQLHPLQAEDTQREVQSALERIRGHVESVSITSIQPLLAPTGRLDLPPTQLQSLASINGFCSFIWRGSVEFDSHRSLAIKILGRYQADSAHFIAKRNLQSGEVLGPSDYERIVEPGCSRAQAEFTPLEGSITRRALRQGERIGAASVKEPAAVEEGAQVCVRASVGGASVSLEAVAEKPGRRGERVFVRNTGSGKRIQVLLTGRGEASAIVSGGVR